ncbi:hypothetical protein [uncultured Microbacterium sp.]|uniref:hypothetical protein n=1 Tax=uncultured Microbacterium sp. TaxID=191216 RepID=UPI0025D7135B|nr:hypothetical protein [uncultured Microbacterium sp.]
MTATASQINAALEAGELEDIKNGHDPAPENTAQDDVPSQRDMAWTQTATPAQIAAAFDAGELDVILGREPRKH